MKRCKICHVQTELIDGRCQSCRRAKEASDRHMTYGKYIAQNYPPTGKKRERTIPEGMRKCRNCGNPFVKFRNKVFCCNECHEKSKSENLISAEKLIEYCQKAADVSQELADKALGNIGHGESEQSALGAYAYLSIQAKMYRYYIPSVVRDFMDAENGGADNG